jgi:hypothetical protein
LRIPHFLYNRFTDGDDVISLKPRKTLHRIAVKFETHEVFTTSGMSGVRDLTGDALRGIEGTPAPSLREALFFVEIKQ